MEITATQGTVHLIITIVIYIGLIMAAALLFDKKPRILGLLGILALTSLGSLLYAYSYWSVSQESLESLAALALLPLFSLSLSLALIIRFKRQNKINISKSLIRYELRGRLPLTIALFVLSTVGYFAASSLLDLTPNLLVPYIVTAIVALLWEPFTRLTKAQPRTKS